MSRRSDAPALGDRKPSAWAENQRPRSNDHLRDRTAPAGPTEHIPTEHMRRTPPVTIRLRRAALAILAGVVAVLALGVGPASAHVTANSADATKGGFAEITLRVPNESDTNSTTSLGVQLPTDTPIANVSIKPVPGWTATTQTEPLNPPVTDDDGNKVTEAISQITWTADPGAGIKPGEYQTFSISAGPLPKTDSLVLPTVQGYDDGTEVAWIDPTVQGQAEPEHPAPTLTLASSSTEATSSGQAASSSTGSGTSGLAVTALIVGIVGLLAGAVGVVLALGARRRATVPAASARERDDARV